jgi:hypothetical protein
MASEIERVRKKKHNTNLVQAKLGGNFEQSLQANALSRCVLYRRSPI